MSNKTLDTNQLRLSVAAKGLSVSVSFDFSELLSSQQGEVLAALSADGGIPMTGVHLGSEMLAQLHSMHRQALASLYRELAEVVSDQT